MSKKNLMLAVGCVLALFLIAGCASIIHGTKQEISFQTTPTGATVEVTDTKGVAYGACETPCTLELKRKHEYKVKMTKPGYMPAEMVIERGSDGWIWGNLFFGGLIGLIIDFSNGAAYKLSPEELIASLPQESTGFEFQTDGELTIVFLDLEELTPQQRSLVLSHEPIRLPVDKIIVD